MCHAPAQSIFIAAALNRAVPVYIMPRFDFLKMLEYTEKFRISDYILVPPVAVALAKHPDVTTCSILGWNPTEISHSASVGELNANCEAKIIDDEGVTELGCNQRGELCVRGPNIMKGYWENPQATMETKTVDGWLKTGDIAYVDSHGRFHVVDRKKVKGNQVAPAELEALLLEHPAVVDAAIIGVPRNSDKSPRAYIVLKPGHRSTADDIIAFMDGKVSTIKRITGGVVFVDVIPKNPSGKILRKFLREQAQEELRRDDAAAKL
ncbi:hypothetical protein BDV26DRAFT_298406 [Aspergillus bertholletiae]|uniref:AMP-binding enzyme n=1 Tax=Aspergillus bertholletiae TaxID=1226010 RepID=A0A5N7AQ53_9EURO|nr:hypothetical protein BDV26DRAFT_298406 [Aspergillus bertholletiae]